MNDKTSVNQCVDLSKIKADLVGKINDNDEIDDKLAELLADVIVENIIKEYRDGRDRVCKDK